ncbi:MAG: hypothetical protein ACFFCQ_10565 [Promethearchaeota archaeon]
MDSFPWKKDLELVDEAQELFNKKQYENWVIFRFGSELASIDDVDLIFRAPTDYPDAILVKVKNGEILQALNAEFEENSSNFKDHAHDPLKCDLIVCARDDWKKRFPNEECKVPIYVVGNNDK